MPVDRSGGTLIQAWTFETTHNKVHKWQYVKSPVFFSLDFDGDFALVFLDSFERKIVLGEESLKESIETLHACVYQTSNATSEESSNLVVVVGCYMPKADASLHNFS
jgi:hypothetical protein